MRSSEARRNPSSSSDCAGETAAEAPRDATAWMLVEIQGGVAKGFATFGRSGVAVAGCEARGACGLAFFFAGLAARAGASAGSGADLGSSGGRHTGCELEGVGCTTVWAVATLFGLADRTGGTVMVITVSGRGVFAFGRGAVLATGSGKTGTVTTVSVDAAGVVSVGGGGIVSVGGAVGGAGMVSAGGDGAAAVAAPVLVATIAVAAKNETASSGHRQQTKQENVVLTSTISLLSNDVSTLPARPSLAEWSNRQPFGRGFLRVAPSTVVRSERLALQTHKHRNWEGAVNC